MTYETHWQWLKAFHEQFIRDGVNIFAVWKANELRHCQIGRIRMKAKP